MSFLFGGGARPQPTSAEKIAAAEAEIEMVSNMFNQYTSPPSPPNLHSNILTIVAML
ncbi:protein transporter tim10 [Friedmanniomyces endolithicus]|nr:protein transporter tim10 [Friedmanniomyces endolithicus]